MFGHVLFGNCSLIASSTRSRYLTMPSAIRDHDRFCDRTVVPGDLKQVMIEVSANDQDRHMLAGAGADGTQPVSFEHEHEKELPADQK